MYWLTHLQNPTLSFVDISSTPGLNLNEVARFGASAVLLQARLYIIGGVIANGMLDHTNEICEVDPVQLTSKPVIIEHDKLAPRPLLIGVSAVSTPSDGDAAFLIMGGSAVCFSFGSFWNEGCYTIGALNNLQRNTPVEGTNIPLRPWSIVHTMTACGQQGALKPSNTTKSAVVPIGVPSISMDSSMDFQHLLSNGKPFVIKGPALGPCVTLWTADYLKEKIGHEREVGRISPP